MAGTRAMILGLALSGLTIAAQPASVPPVQIFFDAASVDATRADAALQVLARSWKNSQTALLVDLARFLPASPGTPEPDLFAVVPDVAAASASPPPAAPVTPAGRARQRIIRFLERQTGQRFGDDLGRWREWMWKLPYDPHPEYGAFKAAIYARVDPKMATFFTPSRGATLPRPAIRLDEIDWGGVTVNGIPPLVSPAVIPAAQANWLKDSHVVYGVVVGRAARAYPRRILAWHEMARDTLGGERITLVYCTLCGTAIPYKSVVGGVHRTFGTSGLLYRSNKLMFDEETMSLWSTLEGRPVVGPLTGTGLTLDFHPVVTTTWGEWRRTHPDTTVLSISTGFDRDYSEGAAYRAYFSTDQLMFRVPALDRRLKNKDEVLGLLLPTASGERHAVAFSVDFLRRTPVHHASYAGASIVVVTSKNGANRIYDAGAVRLVRWLDETTLIDTTGRRWRATEAAIVAEGAGPAAALPRRPAFRAFWFGWFAQFPDTDLVK